MIASPAYSGKVNIQYCLSFANTLHVLTLNGIEVVPLITASGSLLVAERNRILEAFYNSDCTHILMVDSDLGWPGEAVLAMLKKDKEFVGGLYPARAEGNLFVFRPVNNGDGSLIQDDGLFKMEYIPAGFMLLKKSAVEKMRDAYPELKYAPKDTSNQDKGYCLFDTEVWEGEFWGEDYVFCRRARNAGIDIWIDPLIQFDHNGKVGMFAECLVNENGEKVV